MITTGTTTITLLRKYVPKRAPSQAFWKLSKCHVSGRAKARASSEDDLNAVRKMPAKGSSADQKNQHQVGQAGARLLALVVTVADHGVSSSRACRRITSADTDTMITVSTSAIASPARLYWNASW